MNDDELRDLFAGLAMQALLASGGVTLEVGGGSWHDQLAKTSYELADAMLKERDKGSEAAPTSDL